MCAVATWATRLPEASVLLGLSTVACLRAVLALAVLRLCSTVLALGSTVLLLATVAAAVLLCGRGRAVAVMALSAAVVLTAGLVRCWRCAASVCTA